jgi:hypothetical protein
MESGITLVVLNRVLHNKQTKRYESKSGCLLFNEIYGTDV